MRPRLVLLVTASLAAVLLLCLASPASSNTTSKRFAVVLLKALSYDKNLESRAGDELRIGVAYRPGSSDSVKSKDRMLTAFGNLASKGRKVKGLPIEATVIRYEDEDTFEDALSSNDIDVVFITNGFGSEVSAVVDITRRLDKSSLATDSDYVRRGVAIGADTVDKKIKLFVHLKGSKAEGMKLSSKLLKVATVYK